MHAGPRLAEAHDFAIRASARIEIGPAFAANDRKACQSVFEVCSKPRSLMIPTLTDGWKRKPPL